MLKRCSCCGVEKPLTDFQVRQASKDGLTASCKACLKERDRIRDQSPRRIALKKKYVQGKGKNVAYAAKRRYIRKNPKKRAAHVLVGNAIRDGKLLKGVCSVCGDKRVQAHHCDYDKPLEVLWLCPKHHEAWHKKYGEGLNGT